MLEKIYDKILKEKTINIIKANKKYKKMFILSIFLLNLSIYSIPLLLFHLEIIKIPEDLLYFYTRILFDLEPLKIEKYWHGNIISVRDTYFYIDQQCMGFKSIFGVFAIILATPIKDFKKKIKYFLIVLPLVFFINILRIYSTIYLYYFFNFNPHLIHDILWEILNTVFILFMWFLFYKKVKKDVILSS